MKIVGYTDSDFARDLDGKKSTTGMDMLGLSRKRIDMFFFFLGYNLIRWASQKQKIVASCQGIWLARLIGELMNDIQRLSFRDTSRYFLPN